MSDNNTSVTTDTTEADLIATQTSGNSTQEIRALNSTESARRIVEVMVDKKATDVVLLDIHDLSIIADYFVICTASNSRLLGAIADAVDEQLGEEGVPLLRREGKPDSGWILLDFGDIICHVFGPVEREFYRLERLWGTATRLLYVE